MNQETIDYIARHADDDVRQLALQGVRSAGIDLPAALQQIAGRQTARRKLPTWAATEGISYPPHLSMEQCSSERTAQYKARLVAEHPVPIRSLVDLTGGFGVDFWSMATAVCRLHGEQAADLVYVEQNDELCAISSANFQLLGLHAEVVCGDAEEHLQAMPAADLIYIDPARRDRHGGRTYGLADCTPDVTRLLPLLRQKARVLLVKLSPMLDWRKAVSDLQGAAEVHIVSVDNECKELLLKTGETATPRVVCINLRSDGSEQHFEFSASSVVAGPRPPRPSHPAFLYEPNASVMKAGCFAEVEQRYGIRQVAENSHLYVADREISDFIGRGFRIVAVSSMNKKELRRHLSAVERANISCRNFPLSAEQLRQRLKLKDGGSTYIFATTEADGSKMLYICSKIG